KNLRIGKVLLDWSPNADHKSTVGVYSLPAKHARPYVSMPITWEELTKAHKKSDLDLLEFEPAEALQRLKRTGDLFAPLLKVKQSLPKDFAFLMKAPPRKIPRSLTAYHAKRDSARSEEPVPNIPRRSTQGSRRRFVVQ